MPEEKPISFSGQMPRAILAGTKTVTRRPIKPQPEVTEEYLRKHGAWVEGMTLSGHVNAAWRSGFIDVECPYGDPGDRLWVREPWGLAGDMPHDPGYVEYQADCTGNFNDSGDFIAEWKPAKDMDQGDSRITLEITDVRIERLQEITIGQICKEVGARSIYEFIPVTTAIDVFAELWDSIYGAGSWGTNPWVWVVEFKRVTP